MRWTGLLGSFALLLAGPGLRAQSAPNCLQPPRIVSTLPVDSPVNDQGDFNCLGWQEFIALNWNASPTLAGQPDPTASAATFGAPWTNGDPSAVVWQTYIASTDVFLPNGAAPGEFGAAQGLPAACSGSAFKSKLPVRKKERGRFNRGYHALTSISKFTPAFVTSLTQTGSQTLSSIFQASTSSWLTAQNQQVTYYEIRLNEDEFNYIKQNKLYDANCQWQAVQPNGPGVLLPYNNTSYGAVGAIEIKAAWLPLTDPALYSQYLTSKAVVVAPGGSVCQSVVVGLVGLHIIHKTPNAQQFVWATFEHVNNAPDINQVNSHTQQSYTYYNPNCDPATDPYKCAVNTKPPTCGSTPSTPSTPSCNYSAPIQVVRENPLPSSVVALNTYVQSQIKAANPNSVFQYYQLVNVMWPNRNTTIPAGASTPLTNGDAQPLLAQGGLANTTMETYFQTMDTCMSCHTFAPISSAHGSQASPPFAADYSFLFSTAQAPANPQPGECAASIPKAQVRKKVSKSKKHQTT